MRAHAWYSIAAAQGHEPADVEKENLEEIMTPEEIAKGQELASEYWEKYVVSFQKP